MAAALASPPATPPPPAAAAATSTSAPAPTTDFDVVAHYNRLLKSDPSLPIPIAAIETLVDLLNDTPLTTVSETLALVDAQSLVLVRRQSTPWHAIPTSAGTDLFQRFLVASFQQRPSSSSSTAPPVAGAAGAEAEGNFGTLRSKLVETSRLFTSRARQAAQAIAANFLPLVVDGGRVFIYEATPLTDAVIRHAALDQQRRSFTPIKLVHSAITPEGETGSLPFHAFHAAAVSGGAASAASTTRLILSCHAVFSNGALLAPVGAHMLALAARDAGVAVYGAVESFSFVRAYAVGNADLAAQLGSLRGADQPAGDDSGAGDAVEVVPASLVTALVTESGIMAPSGVSEELIKLWF